MTYHACVWIDHDQAKIFEVTAVDASTSTVKSDKPRHHIHRKANHIGLGTVEMDPAMLHEVAEGLKGAKGILIVGPGKAKTVLKAFLDDRHAEIAEKVWDVQPSDHPTDAQLIASARSWFHAQDRMH